MYVFQTVPRESQRSAVLETLNDRTNDPRVLLPQRRRQQVGSERRQQVVSDPIINRRLPIRPSATTPRPAQPQFSNFRQVQEQQLQQQQLQLQQLQQQQFQLQQLQQQQQRQQQQQNFFVPANTQLNQALPQQVVDNNLSNVDLSTGTYTISYGR